MLSMRERRIHFCCRHRLLRRFMCRLEGLILITLFLGLLLHNVGNVNGDWPPFEHVLGKQTILVITVDFSDTEHSVTKSYVEDMIFSKVSSYFREASFNQTWIEGQVTDRWYRLSGTVTSYAERNALGRGNPWKDMQRLVRDVVSIADHDVDFSKFRYVVIVHSGELNGAWGLISPYEIVTKEGPLSRNFAILSERHSLSVYAHEFGHLFGYLPDMYAVPSGNPAFAGPWDLMSCTCYSSPQHFSAWSKIKMGWIHQNQVLTVDSSAVTRLRLDAQEVESNGVLAIRVQLPSTNAYYLLELRTKIGYDSVLPDQGVVAYLVDERKTDWGESVLSVVQYNTSSLEHATFDMRPGKVPGFLDELHGFGLVVISSHGSSRELLIGKLTATRPALTASAHIQMANATIEWAWSEGRIQGLEAARESFLASFDAFNNTHYEEADRLATAAATLAAKATRPSSYEQADQMINSARQLLLNSSFTVPEALELRQQAAIALQNATSLFYTNRFDEALVQAQRSLDLLREARKVEASVLEQDRQAGSNQRTTTFSIIAIIAVSAMVLTLTLGKKRKK